MKTTRGRDSTAFYVTANQVDFSGQNAATYRLYRLFELDEEQRGAKFFITEGALDQHFILEPIEFRARLAPADHRRAASERRDGKGH